MGYASTLAYVEAAAAAVLAQTGLLPHVNAGLMGVQDFAALKRVSASQVGWEWAWGRCGRGWVWGRCGESAVLSGMLGGGLQVVGACRSGRAGGAVTQLCINRHPLPPLPPPPACPRPSQTITVCFGPAGPYAGGYCPLADSPGRGPLGLP